MRKTVLLDRLLRAFPVGQYGLTALLRLVRIDETTEVETACIQCARRPRLRINPDFVERHAETPGKLLMLVMHELHHLILGHTRRFVHPTMRTNFIFDAVINAMLCWLLPDPECIALLTNFYPDDRFPECMLRPPAGWRPGDDPIPMPPALRPPAFAELAQWYQALYSRAGLSYDELSDALAGKLPPESLEEVVLLGGHDGEDDSTGRGNMEARSPLLHEALAGAAGTWKVRQAEAGMAYSRLRAARVGDIRAGDRATLARLLKRIGVGDAGWPNWDRGPRPSEFVSAIPGFDRRSIALRAIGEEPLLYRHEITEPGRGTAGGRVHVYLDVSGSMSDLLGPLYGALLACRADVHPRVHLFSTEVADVPISGLRSGACRTTRGTQIACVARHVREHRVRRAVLVTDGCVGRLSNEDAETLRSIPLGVALT
ncbi:MAG: hypothetical protein ACYS0D_15815, partial [Planctomycetota bacterium]